jgi:hypothetical protein
LPSVVAGFETEYGTVVELPTIAPSSEYSTREMGESRALATDEYTMGVLSATTAPCTGDVRMTLDTPGEPSDLTYAAEDADAFPRSSNARAEIA